MKTFLRANWDRALAAALVLAGVVALIVGWVGVSGTGLTAEQNPYLISGGLAGIALIAVGCTLWVSADLQDEWRRLDALEQRLAERESTTTSKTIDQEETNGAQRRSSPRQARARVSK